MALPSRAYRQRLRDALAAAGFTVCGETENRSATVDDVRATQPDVILIDTQLSGAVADDVTATVYASLHSCIIVLAEAPDVDEMCTVLRHGAAGYLPRATPAPAIVRAVRGALAGEAAIPRRLVAGVVVHLRTDQQRRLWRDGLGPVRLTTREWEILDLLADGRTTAEIARTLYVSPVTVRSHIATAVKKLGVDDRDAAVRAITGA